MIGKAVFWVGLLALLTPHEPNLGLGRPSAAIPENTTVNDPYAAPQQREDFVSGLPRALQALRQDLLERTPQLRAEIRESLSRHAAPTSSPSPLRMPLYGPSGLHL
jgi:hypothetical protein